MNWFRIPKELNKTPTLGKYYWHWKEELSVEGKQQCVYCSININSFGGIRNFHVEHYKPKAADKFPKLEHEYSNLFFACSICNSFKSDDWKNEPNKELDNEAFPDPSKINYSDFLFIDSQFNVDSKFFTGKYIINKLYLNRPQLILERKNFYLHIKLKSEIEKLIEILGKLNDNKTKSPIIRSYIDTCEVLILLLKEKYINPYTTSQITR